MKIIHSFVCVATLVKIVLAAPSPEGFRFPSEARREKKLVPLTPPVLPILEHLENDPSTFLPNETREKGSSDDVKPRFGFGGDFNVRPSGNGGITASASHSASGGGASQAASQSFSIGFNKGFSASHSASQSASFNGFGNGFGGSQASSQAASFSGSGNALSGSAASSSAFGGRPTFGGSGSQSASSAFGFGSDNFPVANPNFGDDLLDVRHRGAPNFPFPNFFGKSGIGAAAFRKSRPQNSGDDFLTPDFNKDFLDFTNNGFPKLVFPNLFDNNDLVNPLLDRSVANAKAVAFS